MLEVGARRVLENRRLAGHGHRRGKSRRLERNRQRATGDERTDAGRLPDSRRLMPGDDLLHSQPSSSGDARVGRKAIGRGLGDPDQSVAGPELDPLGSRRWLDRHRRSFRARAKERDAVQRIRIEIDISGAAVAGDTRDASTADDETRPEQLRRAGQIGHHTSRRPGVVRQLHEPAIRLRGARAGPALDRRSRDCRLAASSEAARPASGLRGRPSSPADGWSSSAAASASGGSTHEPHADLERSPGARSAAFEARRRAPPRAAWTSRTSSTIGRTRATGPEAARPGGSPRRRTAACPPRLVISSSSPGMSDDSATSTDDFQAVQTRPAAPGSVRFDRNDDAGRAGRRRGRRQPESRLPARVDRRTAAASGQQAQDEAGLRVAPVDGSYHGV